MMVMSYDPFIGLYITMTMMIFLLIGVAILFTPSKSKRYRKVLADLYVAAKIRDLANEDGFDLALENECLKKWSKKERINYVDLDESIEEDLQERVAEGAKTKSDSKEKPKESK